MSYHTFKSLHNPQEPLLLCNIWDAHSAQIAEEAGAKALGTSSHVISNAIGLEDGNNLHFDQLLSVVKNIMQVATVPVSVDIESGYSDDPKVIADYIQALAAYGVSGVNIEDSKLANGERVLQDAAVFADLLSKLTQVLDERSVKVFINVRTDTYVTKHAEALKESIARGNLYKNSGADGLFVPLISDANEIKAVVAATELPLNVFATAEGPDYEAFKAAGVHRISSGNAAYAKIMDSLKEIYTDFQNKNLKALF